MHNWHTGTTQHSRRTTILLPSFSLETAKAYLTIHPIWPPTPTLPIPEPKKNQRYGEKCPKCKREYLYDHVAWAQGYKSGYTCRCPEEETPSKPSSSSQKITTNLKWPSLQNKLCQSCGTNPTHAKILSGIQMSSLPPPHPRTGPVPPETYNWDYNRYYEIKGYEDSDALDKV